LVIVNSFDTLVRLLVAGQHRHAAAEKILHKYQDDDLVDLTNGIGNGREYGIAQLENNSNEIV